MISNATEEIRNSIIRLMSKRELRTLNVVIGKLLPQVLTEK